MAYPIKPQPNRLDNRDQFEFISIVPTWQFLSTHDKKPHMKGTPEESPVLFFCMYFRHIMLQVKQTFVVTLDNVGSNVFGTSTTYAPERNWKTVLITAVVDSRES